MARAGLRTARPTSFGPGRDRRRVFGEPLVSLVQPVPGLRWGRPVRVYSPNSVRSRFSPRQRCRSPPSPKPVSRHDSELPLASILKWASRRLIWKTKTPRIDISSNPPEQTTQTFRCPLFPEIAHKHRACLTSYPPGLSTMPKSSAGATRLSRPIPAHGPPLVCFPLDISPEKQQGTTGHR